MAAVGRVDAEDQPVAALAGGAALRMRIEILGSGEVTCTAAAHAPPTKQLLARTLHMCHLRNTACRRR